MTGRKHEWYFDECIHCGTRRLLLRSKRPVVEHFVAENAAAGPIAAMTADRDAWAAESAENLRKLVAVTARIDAMRDDIITLGAQVNSLMRERDAALAQVATAYEAGAAAADQFDGYSIPAAFWPHEIARAIRTLTPTDATAALDRLLRQARAEGMRKAADLIPSGWTGEAHVTNMDFGPNVAAKARSAILAAARQEEQQ